MTEAEAVKRLPINPANLWCVKDGVKCRIIILGSGDVEFVPIKGGKK